MGSSRLAVQFSDETPSSSPRPSPRDVGDVMQFFAQQEKSLQESFLSLPKKSAKKQRSPSPKVTCFLLIFTSWNERALFIHKKRLYYVDAFLIIKCLQASYCLVSFPTPPPPSPSKKSLLVNMA